MFVYEITIDEPNLEALSKRGFNRVMRSAFAALGDHWHSEILPGHFEPTARAKYKHEPRSEKYLETKDRIFSRGRIRGNARTDNVYSGASQDALTRFRIVKSFPTRLVVEMLGPNHWRINFARGQINKAAEITTVTEQEQRSVVPIVEKAVEEALQLEVNKTRRVKI